MDRPGEQAGTGSATRQYFSAGFRESPPDAPTGSLERPSSGMRRLLTILFCALASLLVTGTSAATPGSQGSGSVRWRFQVNGAYVLYRPAVGPDGGVVVASSTGDVYSLTADGALRWVVPSIGG